MIIYIIYTHFHVVPETGNTGSSCKLMQAKCEIIPYSLDT